MQRLYEDALFPLDAIVLEENSRDFEERVLVVNRNAEFLCDYLVKHPKGGPA